MDEETMSTDQLQKIVDTAFQTGALEALMNLADNVEHKPTREDIILVMGSLIINSTEGGTYIAEPSLAEFQERFWEEYQKIANQREE